MSGLEVIGFVFGACGFVGQVIHYSKKYRGKKKAKLITTNTTKVVTTQSTAPHGQLTRVRRTSQSQVAVQLDHGRTIREQWTHFSDIQRDNNEVVRAGIRAIERSYDSRDRANEVAWETVRAMNAVYVEENRRFTFTTLVLASLITFLAFFLGVYTGENSILKQFHYPPSWSFPISDSADGADLQHSVVAVTKGAVSGFTFLPIQLPWYTCKAIFDGLGQGLGNIGSVFAKDLSNAAVDAAVVTVSTMLLSVLSNILWLIQIPSRCILDLIMEALAFCGVPRIFTISFLGALAGILQWAAGWTMLLRTKQCEAREKDTEVEALLWILTTFLCVAVARFYYDVLGLETWFSAIIGGAPVVMILIRGRRCWHCYLICPHPS